MKVVDDPVILESCIFSSSHGGTGKNFISTPECHEYQTAAGQENIESKVKPFGPQWTRLFGEYYEDFRGGITGDEDKSGMHIYILYKRLAGWLATWLSSRSLQVRLVEVAIHYGVVSAARAVQLGHEREHQHREQQH